MMQVAFPWQIPFRTSRPRMVGTAREPRQSISGAETVVPSFGGRWECDVEMLIHGEAAELAYQAFIAQMEGRVGTTLLPIWTRWRPRDRDGQVVDQRGTAGLADAQTWEHFGFEAVPVVTMALAEPAALRATTIKVEPYNTTGIRPGQHFSIGERLYVVQHHWQDSAGVTNLMIWPPLRQSLGQAQLVLDRPFCLMRLASEGADLEYTPTPAGRVTATFVEAEV